MSAAAYASAACGWQTRGRALRRVSVGGRVHARVLDPRRRVLPHFVIIGGQRCGTTSLYDHLSGHPQVRTPLRKEVHFLSLHWDRGLPWYRRHFPVVSDPAERTFEASPYYLFHPDAPTRAAAALPDARFVVLLREPAERAVSHWCHNRANRLEPLPLAQALDAEQQRLACDPSGSNHRLYAYAGRGLYAEQIRRWRAAVGDRLLVLLSEDLFTRPDHTIRTVLDFVGLDPWEGEGFEAHGARREDAVAVPAPVRRRLQEHFAAPNRELAALLDRDLSVWSHGVVQIERAQPSARALTRPTSSSDVARPQPNGPGHHPSDSR